MWICPVTLAKRMPCLPDLIMPKEMLSSLWMPICRGEVGTAITAVHENGFGVTAYLSGNVVDGVDVIDFSHS